MHQFDDPAVLTEGNVFVDSKWLRFSEILQDYNPEYELRWIPPVNRTNADSSKPYAIVHTPSDGKPPYIVMFAGELDNPQDVIATLWAGDLRRHNVMAQLDLKEMARQVFEAKVEQEKQEALRDQAAFLMDSSRSKNWVNWVSPSGEKVKLDSFRRRV